MEQKCGWETRGVATVFYPSGFAFGASDKDLMGLKHPSVEMGGGLERAEHFVLEKQRGG